VYDYLALKNGATVTADNVLESAPEERGGASAAKREAEDIALAQLQAGRPAWTILRPSYIFGGGRDLSRVIGVRRGGVVVSLGTPWKLLRLLHVGDVAEAVVRLVDRPQSAGRVYTLSHPDRLTCRAFVRTCLRDGGPDAPVVLYVPESVARLGALAMGVLLRVLGRRAGITRRRLAYLFRGVTVDATRFQAELGWAPSGRLVDQLRAERQAQRPKQAEDAKV
jgi:nucleoside-diphosphate-sugar epimerase